MDSKLEEEERRTETLEQVGGCGFSTTFRLILRVFCHFSVFFSYEALK